MSSRPIRGAARLAAILDALPDALLLVNSNGTVVDANQAAIQALQAPGTSLIGRGVLDLLPEFDPSRIPGSMRPAKSEPESPDQAVRMTICRTDGSTFPVEVFANDFTDDGASSLGGGFIPAISASDNELLLLMVRDLTAKLSVEAELRRQHKQTEMILRAAAEGVLGVDLDGRVVLVNPAAAHILDYRASELGGRELHPLIQHSQADGSPLAVETSALTDTLVSGHKHRVRGTVLWRKDGTPVTVDLTTAPVRDGEQLVGAVMTFTDRTKELALVARNEHLTAVLESELSNALAALHGRIDALAADPAGQLWPEANWTLRRLADECRRFGRLIDGVLEHQRFEGTAESGKESLDRESVGLDSVIQRAVERSNELLGPGRVRFSVHSTQVEVSADRDRLAGALAHLVADVSVIPSMDPASAPQLPPIGGDAPMVVLAAAQRGDVARIEVRGPARTAGPVHLPIAKAIVERHGGVLQRHELPNGTGSTYVVELPIDPEATDLHAGGGKRRVPQETDTAMLPDLPEVPPARSGDNPKPAGSEASGARTAIALGPAGPPAEAETSAPQEPRRSRRRRGAPANEESSGALHIPGVPDPGTPVYPGLEKSLAEQAAAESGASSRPNRRRRLSLPSEPSPAASFGAVELARPQAAQPKAEQPAQPQPVGSGLGELAPPRPLGFAENPTNAFPQANGASGGRLALPAPSGAADGPVTPVRPRTPPQSVPALSAVETTTPNGSNDSSGAGWAIPTAEAGPRSLLVWPELEPSTQHALEERGYRPVTVHSREEVDSQVAGHPAALFVDPLTGPITRTGLQSLRTAALNRRVPVVVTAGLGQATKDSAYGADPAVLLKALAPRDSENHAARVLLVESDADIAAALISSLERRGMHVEHAADENDAVARASSVQPNLVVMDLLQIRRRRVGVLDWLAANDRLHRTPLLVYTSVDLDPQELPRLRTGETVLFLAERSANEDIQARVVDLLGRIGSLDVPAGVR